MDVLASVGGLELKVCHASMDKKSCTGATKGKTRKQADEVAGDATGAGDAAQLDAESLL